MSAAPKPKCCGAIEEWRVVGYFEIRSKNQSAGDAWLWVAIDADTKLVPCWTIGQRDSVTARDFMEDLAGRLKNRVQLTSDGLKLYLEAVDNAFTGYIDYSMLVKIYGIDPQGESVTARRNALGARQSAYGAARSRPHQHFVCGAPESQRAHDEPPLYSPNQRLSKKIENHIAAVALGDFA